MVRVVRRPSANFSWSDHACDLKIIHVRSVCADNVSLKRVIGIIVRMMPPRENDAPRRAVMITRMHILRDIGCRRNCPWNMLRCVWVYEYEMRVGSYTCAAQMRAWQTSCKPLSRCKRYADYAHYYIYIWIWKIFIWAYMIRVIAVDEIYHRS